ncbi:nucleotidyltransferase domain-containing protein [Nannocystis punicea]|uniref:Nucleotidyltransferase domain-containing protein n=1 Tax=Nannocystis punicea TaxID=2995304 RepID=A0ABY7H8Q2_9BACT|nr:nucleotidyltransferase domain-containing protein [Nannocystis poenicansa]WAS95652.1 nucleotidyltransferase domain-containing protein [Nannocystis poenicansa]
MTPSLSDIAAMIAGRYGCHAVLLYGSRARGDHEADSDHDLFALRDAGPSLHEVFTWRGAAIDVFVESDAAVAGEPAPALLRLHGAVVLRDDHGRGAALLQRIAAAHARPPATTAATEVATLRAWADKMLVRLDDPDPVLAGLRRAELLTQLLEIRHGLVGRRWSGFKEGVAWARLHDRAVYDAYRDAVAPSATRTALQHLVDLVFSPADSGGSAG